jgi:hypothetical protein
MHDPDPDYPYINTQATKMFAEGVREAASRGVSQRTLAKKLRYRGSVVLSHMASGRTPIPIDRGVEYATLLGLPVRKFLLALLDQRYPEIDWRDRLYVE